MNDNLVQFERLQKVLARLGVASRRQAEVLIQQGTIKVNGKTVTEPGTKVSETDRIEVNGAVVRALPEEHVYLMMNKPEGVISSVTDPRGRKTVIDLVKPSVRARIYPVGRLDYDTSGLLVLTNDGELTFRLTHPSYGVEKTYRVWVRGTVPPETLDKLASGVPLEDGMTSPAKIKQIAHNPKKGKEISVVELTIHEGKNRQVRRMFDQVGLFLVRLERISFGPLHLDPQLKPGEFRVLDHNEEKALKSAAGLEV